MFSSATHQSGFQEESHGHTANQGPCLTQTGKLGTPLLRVRVDGTWSPRALLPFWSASATWMAVSAP